jgi:DNA-directed RNA polymerase I, II, and III subunit RPABC2
MSDIDELELDKNSEIADSEIGSSDDEDDEQSVYDEPKASNPGEEDDEESIKTEIEDDDSESDNENLSDDNDNEDENENEDEYGEEENIATGPSKKTGVKNFTSVQSVGLDDDDDDDDDEDDAYLQKFNEQINKNYIADNHPECVNVNYDEIIALSKVVRDDKNNIIDNLHITLPYLTKYEKARILGQRAKQINMGMPAFVKVPENIIDGYLVAEMELTQKRIPFIIKRPIPGGGCEYWKVSDLELIAF